jgi:hypothetical protein
MSKNPDSIINWLSIDEPCKVADEDHVETVSGSFCLQCSESVFDLSLMTRAEAERFLSAREHKLPCIRYASDEQGAMIFRTRPQPQKSSFRDRIWDSIACSTLAATLFLAGCSSKSSTSQAGPDASALVAPDATTTGTQITNDAICGTTSDAKTSTGDVPDRPPIRVIGGKPTLHKTPRVTKDPVTPPVIKRLKGKPRIHTPVTPPAKPTIKK